ncbi:hypothetical protein SKA58_06165 [Sphingomonas sp. SKA58]|nr:hypothetical protein SKA58_06165 [Sphingomonas sp. SKA58]
MAWSISLIETNHCAADGQDRYKLALTCVAA